MISPIDIFCVFAGIAIHKNKFKRPTCSIRKSSKMQEFTDQKTPESNLLAENPVLLLEPEDNSANEVLTESNDILLRLEIENDTIVEISSDTDVVRETMPKTIKKLESTKIESLFRKLILYSEEEKVLNEVANYFTDQEPSYIAE